MPSNPQRKQAKQHKRRIREKEIRKARNLASNISLRDYVLQMTRGEWSDCYEDGAQGMYRLTCVRKTHSGFGASFFLLDEFCLGVKDADVIRDVDISAIEDFNRERGGRMISPAYARKKISALIDWARGLGFEPHPKTHLAMEIFRDVDPSSCLESFSFGRPEDGKPMFISGPFDSPDRIRTILEKLQRLGKDNHYFAVGINDSMHRALTLDQIEILPPEFNDEDLMENLERLR